MAIIPTMVWQNGNRALQRLHDFDRYEITKQNGLRLELTYNEAENGPVVNDRNAYRIEFVLKDGVLATPDEGDEAGFPRYVDGAVKAVRYYDKAGNLLVVANGLDYPISVLFNNVTESSDGFNAMAALLSTITKYIGSDNSKAPDGWNGDNIRTGTNDDTINARRGDDYIQDRGGSDVYNGGLGYDMLSYDDWFYFGEWAKSGINANMLTKSVVGPDGETDTFTSIEAIRGTFMDDTFMGNLADNSFMGMQGDDTIHGNQGSDRVEYQNDYRQGGEFGVRVNLAQGTATDGFGDTDTLMSIERVRGSIFGDIIKDSNKDNSLEGRQGNDTLIVARGNDYLEGDQGADRFVFVGNNFGHDVVGDFNDGQGDKIRVVNANSMNDLTISQDGSATRIEFGANSITLNDFNANNLTVDDFLF